VENSRALNLCFEVSREKIVKFDQLQECDNLTQIWTVTVTVTFILHKLTVTVTVTEILVVILIEVVTVTVTVILVTICAFFEDTRAITARYRDTGMYVCIYVCMYVCMYACLCFLVRKCTCL
jgi:hypothetical protein